MASFNERSSLRSTTSKSVIKQILLDELLEGDTCNSQTDYLQMGEDFLSMAVVDRAAKQETGRIPDYVEMTVPTYSDPMFRSHFRMTRTSLNELIDFIGPKFGSMKSVSLEKRTLACIWYLGNMETFRGVADRFGISKGTLHFLLSQFSNMFKDHIFLQNLISWPTTEEKLKEISEKFSQRAGFPNVVGAIDGTYVQISGPSEHRDSYICRKGFPAMQLQGVCDSQLKFLDVFCAYPGSVHDARVYRNSPLFEVVQNLQANFHLLGDSAYPMSTNLLTPYRDNGHLTLEEKRFNNSHSSTRVDIERTFGLLKVKFRKLKFLDMRNVEDIPSIIITCCALHNFILMHEGLDESEVDMEDTSVSVQSENDVQDIVSGAEKRRDIMALLL